MKIINLRDYYPFYTQDTLLEVSDEVAEALADAERSERNHIRRMFYNKAQYSLDAEDGIESVGNRVPYSFAGGGARSHGAALSLVQGFE